MKLKRETHICPECGGKNLRKSLPVNHKEEDVLEENPDYLLCGDCSYYGPCQLAEEEHKDETEEIELHEIEEEKPEKKHKKSSKKK